MTITEIKLPFLYFLSRDFDKFFYRYYKQPSKDKHGNTLAHLCMMHNKLDYLPLVTDDFSTKNDLGLTPLDIAYHLGRDLSALNIEEKNPAQVWIYRNLEKRFDIFNEDEMRETFKIDYLDHLRFKNASILHTVFKQVERRLKCTQTKWKNHWTCCMHENDFLSKRMPKAYIQWVNPLIGYGLFAYEEIPQYTYIGEYTGIVRKRKAKADLTNDYIFGYVVGGKESSYVIDAKERGNFTRFINHSDNPNLFSTWMVSQGVCHIILFASRLIPKGEQMTYDYGPFYWQKRTAPAML